MWLMWNMLIRKSILFHNYYNSHTFRLCIHFLLFFSSFFLSNLCQNAHLIQLNVFKKRFVSPQETAATVQRNNNLTDYYQSLRENMITLLEHVRIPNAPGGPQEKMSHENFDSYLTKLQTLCTADGYCADEANRPIYETVKTALQDFTVLPTPIWDHP